MSGDAPWSARLIEAMSVGCIPIIISDGWILPFQTIIDWRRLLLRFSEHSFLQIVRKSAQKANSVNDTRNNESANEILSKYYDNHFCLWHREILQTFETFFSDTRRVTQGLLSVIDTHLNVLMAANLKK